MKKNGFTLIEILATIIILATIALIAFPAVLNLLNNLYCLYYSSKTSI